MSKKIGEIVQRHEARTHPKTLTKSKAIRTPHVAVVIAATWIAAFLVSLDFTAVTVTLPTLARDFGVGTGLTSWASLSYMLVMVALTLIAGPIIERLGPRLALAGSLAAFAAASLAASLSTGLWILVTCRAAQGAGASVMFVIGPAMIKTMLTEQQQARAFAVFSTAPMAGLAAGPAVGGELTALFGWQSVFLPNLPLAAVALLLTLAIGGRPDIARIEAPQKGSARVKNAISVVTAPIALASMVLAINQGDELGWSSLPIVSLMVIFVAAATATVFSERRSNTPLLVRRVVRAKDFLTSAALFSVLLAVSGGLAFVMPFYFEWLLKRNAGTVGHLLAVQPVATMAVSTFSGVILGFVARRSLCLAGIGLVSLGISIYAVATIPLSILVPIGGLVLIGAGAGLYYPALMQLSLSKVPAELAASASSLQTTIRVLAQMLGLVIFETLFSDLYPMARDANLAAHAAGKELETMQLAFRVVFWFASLLVALAIVPGLRLSKRASTPVLSTPSRRRRLTS